MSQDIEKGARLYVQLMSQGMSPGEAFAQAFPNGIPTRQEKLKEEAGNAQKQALGQGAGVLAGGLGGKAVYDYIGGTGWFAEKAAEEAVKQSVAQGAAQSAAQTGASQIAAPTVVSASRIPAAGGGEALSKGSEALGANTFGSATPYLGAAGAALGAYNAYQGIKKGNPITAALGGGGIGLGLNMMGVGLGPIGWAAALGVPIAGALLNNHESTREHAAKNTQKLAGMGGNDPQWQGYLQGARAQYSAPPPDPSKPFAGKYATWEDYQRGGLEAGDLTHVYGNLQTFGPEWAKLSEDQRRAVTQGIIDAGLYDSKKGEVVITDPTRGKTIYQQVIKGQPKAPATKQDLEREKQRLKAGSTLVSALA